MAPLTSPRSCDRCRNRLARFSFAQIRCGSLRPEGSPSSLCCIQRPAAHQDLLTFSCVRRSMRPTAIRRESNCPRLDKPPARSRSAPAHRCDRRADTDARWATSFVRSDDATDAVLAIPNLRSIWRTAAFRSLAESGEQASKSQTLYGRASTATGRILSAPNYTRSCDDTTRLRNSGMFRTGSSLQPEFSAGDP